MYLSRLILNSRSRAVRRDLADCQELHRTILSGFPDTGPEAGGVEGGARARFGILYRVDASPRTGRIALLVQSRVSPDWSGLADGYLADTAGDPPNPDIKPLTGTLALLREGMVLDFRLLANATRRVSTRCASERSGAYGKRVGLRSDADRIAWLRRKAERAGFRLLGTVIDDRAADLRVLAGQTHTGRRRAAREGAAPGALAFAPTLFEGRLQVTDAQAFRDALAHGIGPAKAYGFGLLSIAPVGGAAR